MPSWLPFGSPETTYFATGTIATTAAGKTFFEMSGPTSGKAKIKKIMVGAGGNTIVTVTRHTALVLTSPTVVTPRALVAGTATSVAQKKTASAITQLGNALFTIRVFAALGQTIDFGDVAGQELELNGAGDVISFSCDAITDTDVTIIFSEV